MNVAVKLIDGSDTGKKTKLADEIFKAEINSHAIYETVRSVRANQRQGTHQTKGRSYVSGGGKKPFKQKGTGNARQGTTRAPHMTGGGRVFGPQPRSYGFKLNRKLNKIARRSAFSQKVADKALLVVEDFKIKEPKTKQAVEILKNLKIENQKVLFLTAEQDMNLYRSVSNIIGVSCLEARNASVYDLMDAKTIVVQKSAIKVINEVLG